MLSSIQILKHTRNSIHRAVKDHSPEQFLAIPEGFDNNVAWNLGHIIMVQQSVCYGRSGLDSYISDEMVAMYKPGTSPADWTTDPNGAELVDMMMDHMQKLEDDYRSGKFGDTFEAMTTSSGLHVPDLDAGIMFNIYHEAQHMGTILSLNNFVAS